MPIVWREITASDLEECLRIDSRHMGHELIGEARALVAWKELLRLPFFTAGALVRSGNNREILGFAAACFVSADFTDGELANPRPGTNARFLDRFAAGRSIVLNRTAVARANASHGVDVFQLYGTLRHDLSEEEQFEAVGPMFAKFTEYLRGHRVRTVLAEITSESEKRFTRGSGTALIELPETNRFLSCATRESVAEVPSSVGLSIFLYEEPVLRLRPTDQELLLAADSAVTDKEIGRQLGLTQNAVKARWRSAIARIAEARPELVDCDDRVRGRGQQKRHRILAYVRKHLEELRPYDWGTSARKRAIGTTPPRAMVARSSAD